ncbi:hypothetical protein PN500_05365 [Dolichospermum circinale CS-541/06]|nr:hypothetical protein [Dolichospermum circinale]MDB9453722.1 hypothetical protein [Dolichospermum circinale CS-541/06]MDB9464581.1 hypothetical protein [Dolichospermum circinale CS-541/04]MDB9549579.1 hypothetical protein [Dolichospermum circinale CS-1031]
MLTALHPANHFCIGEIPVTTKNSFLLNPFKPDGEEYAFFLDLASGSRSHGRFTFTNQRTIGKKYYGTEKKDQWKRIIYGSILHTGCKKLIYMKLNYVVVDDENLKNGQPFDDPINNIHWETGDSHAKASKKLMSLLGLPVQEAKFDPDTGEIIEPEIVDIEKPIQFRAGFRNNDGLTEWVGKGTVAYNSALDTHAGNFDLVIPLSSLKGNKPALGNHQGKLLFGLVFDGEIRRAKPGWMLLQWFTFEQLQEDGIISTLGEKCEQLSESFDSIVKLAKVIGVSQEEAEAEIIDVNDKLESEAEYVNTMIRIITADKNGVLLLHPYIVSRVKDRVRALWLNLAKAAGIRFYSVMAQPDESLAKYNIVHPDGSIGGLKIFCAPDFKEGEYILFVNPMRHWGDCQIWENRHEGTYVKATGIMAAPKKLLLTLGRDTDGDFLQLINTKSYPKLTEAIRNFKKAPVTVKFPKMALQGNLQRIAIKSMTDLTGVVASLLARARVAGVEGIVLLIPAGGEQKSPKEMPIIDFLSQQVQIAVDSLKSAYPNNVNGLNAVKEYLDSIENSQAPWLKDFKSKDCYRIRPCEVEEQAKDTISRIVKFVNVWYKTPQLPEEISPEPYEFTLFSQVNVDERQIYEAILVRSQYRAAMADAFEWRDANDGDSTRIREVSQLFKSKKDEILSTKIDGKSFTVESWAAAYWRGCHQASSGGAGLVFTLFADEIVAELGDIKLSESKVLHLYAVNKGKWSMHKDGKIWNGHEVQIRIALYPFNGKQVLCADMAYSGAKVQLGFHILGCVRESYIPYYPVGMSKTMKIYATKFHIASGMVSEVILFDLTVPQWQIDEWLNFK